MNIKTLQARLAKLEERQDETAPVFLTASTEDADEKMKKLAATTNRDILCLIMPGPYGH